MPKPFSAESRRRAARENIEYYHGDDLFKVAWIGPRVPEGSPEAERKMAEIKRVFQAHNVLRELVDNWKNGLISQPFRWHLKDSNGERVEATEAEIDLQRWIDWVEQQAVYKDPCHSDFHESDPWTEFVLAVGVCGEGSLRLWQPQRYAEIDDAIKRIHLHVPRCGAVMVQRDQDGFIERIDINHGSVLETHRMEPDGTTVVNVSEREEPIEVEAEGRWLIQTIRMPSLITDSGKRKQGAICHALTMKLRNQELGGFKERTFLNAEFPVDNDGEPIEIQRGPGIDQYAYGVPTGDPQTPTYANAQMVESEPVSPATFIESMQADIELLYREFRQGHLLSTNDGRLSGESRIQMRQNFEHYLNGWKRPIESAIANVLNIVLKLLEYEDLEAVVELSITTGKLSAEERAEIRSDYQAGLLSKSTAIALLGCVDDVDAELALIDEEMAEKSANQPDPLPTNPLTNPLDRVNDDDNPREQ
ncbi:MAG: hypothetical protein AAFV72_00370 [Cyanobacteria bacterium J06635_1]